MQKDDDLSKFVPNSGRPLPQETVKEMARLERVRAGVPTKKRVVKKLHHKTGRSR